MLCPYNLKNIFSARMPTLHTYKKLYETTYISTVSTYAHFIYLWRHFPNKNVRIHTVLALRMGIGLPHRTQKQLLISNCQPILCIKLDIYPECGQVRLVMDRTLYVKRPLYVIQSNLFKISYTYSYSWVCRYTLDCYIQRTGTDWKNT